MGIFDKLKRLIPGASGAPVGQAPMRTIPQGTISEPRSVTMGELQNAPMPSWMADVCSGFRFCATMQLRTPLRVLLRHGEIHTDRTKQPPKIALEMWEGIWVPEVKPYPGMPPPGMMASTFGPIPTDGGDYLPFLIAVRRIIEAHDTIEHRIEKLREMPLVAGWKTYVDKHGPSHISESRGIDWIIDCFFPRFIKSIPKLTAGIVDELSRFGLDTPNRIAAATDEVLLGIKGIGRAKLQAMRERCACITESRDADRVENVIR